MSTHAQLYRFNHPVEPCLPDAGLAASALGFEAAWIARLTAQIAAEHPDTHVEHPDTHVELPGTHVETLDDFRAALERQLADERARPSEGARFIAEVASRQRVTNV